MPACPRILSGLSSGRSGHDHSELMSAAALLWFSCIYHLSALSDISAPEPGRVFCFGLSTLESLIFYTLARYKSLGQSAPVEKKKKLL